MSSLSIARSIPSVTSSSSFPSTVVMMDAQTQQTHPDAGTAASVTSPSSGHPLASTGRLLIVANRLPVSMSIKKGANNETSDISFTQSSGGLVSALAGTDMESVWIGWPGGEVKPGKDRLTVHEKLRPLKSIPVFLTAELCDLFYNGFCNDLLWPLFHYIPLPIDAIKAHDKQFKAYQKANAEFAKVVLENYEDGDAVWVHDYHLMLLPSLLRRAKPSMRIGFFFHTPFPSSEIYRVIPSRADLLHGVLSSNLLGFHTHDYSRHFQSAATRIIGAQCSNEQIKLNGQIAQLGTFPIGIDPQKFVDALQTEGVQKHLAELTKQFADRKVLLGIDRLDYIKGIAQKLHSLELFLDRHPEFVGKVVLVQIAIPSRTDVVEYQRLRTATHELVGRINGKFGSVASVPIHYLDQSIPFDKMCAMYRLADAMVITSIRDGMNLVAYEYIACQHGHNGVLILSEFAGAAQSLGAGALQVNPWNISEVADAIEKALTMNDSERQSMTDYSFNHVMTHTAKAWAREFVDELEQIDLDEFTTNFSASSSSLASLADRPAVPAPLDINEITEKFTAAKHRLIITGLAGIVLRSKSIGAATSVSASSETLTQFDADNAAFGGEIFGWQEPVHSSTAQTASFAQSKSSVVKPASGSSRYQSHHRRPSSYGGLLSGDHSISMEEWMEMTAEADYDDIPATNSGQQPPSVEELKQAIIALASDPHTTYLILTSRAREWCDALFPSVEALPPNLWFAAENGYFFKHGAAKSQQAAHADAAAASPASASLSSPSTAALTGWHVMYENVDFSWMEGVNRVMTYFCERTPRSYIQAQETSMQWHYGDADPVFAKRQALDLVSHLTGGPLANTATEVLDSANIVQVRPLAVSKGRALKHLLAYLTKKYKRAAQQAQQQSNAIETGDADSSPISSFDGDLDDGNGSTSASGVSVGARPAGLRSRRPSLADTNETTTAFTASSRASPSPASSTTGTGASILSPSLPIDFVLCIGNFLERDEDIFPLLNDWTDLGHLPPGLQSYQPSSNTGSGQGSSTGTPSFHHRRISLGQSQGQTQVTALAPLSVNTSQAQTTKHAHVGGTTASPVSVLSIPDMAVSPSSDTGGSTTSTPATFGSTGTDGFLSVYTVTVGAKVSKARFFLTDLDAVNALVVKLAHAQSANCDALQLSPVSASGGHLKDGRWKLAHSFTEHLDEHTHAGGEADIANPNAKERDAVKRSNSAHATHK